MSDNFKVSLAAFIGAVAPGANGFLENLEPILRALLTLGQVGVAAVTILYIYRKWKNARKGKDE